MEMRDELQRVLDCIANLTDINTTKDVKDKDIISQSNRPPHDVYNHLIELQSNGLIKKVNPRPTDVDFTLWNITPKGIQQFVNNQKIMNPGK